jgi:hypothetical protein
LSNVVQLLFTSFVGREQQLVVGQAEVEVPDTVSSGERIGIAADGHLAPTRSSADSIGKVVGKPDANGMATVIVNFK